MRLFPSFRRPVSLPADDLAVRTRYLEGFKTKLRGRTPVRDIRFVVLDTETTGLDPRKDKILSLAAVEVRNFRVFVARRFEAFFHQENYLPDDSVKVHGIMKRHSDSGQGEKQIMAAFLDFVQTAVIVGHHIQFDVSILNETLYRYFQVRLKNKTLDTARLASRIKNPHDRFPKPEGLDKLCQEYRIPLGKRHTAAGDTFITSMLFLKLLGELEQKGVKTVKELVR